MKIVSVTAYPSYPKGVDWDESDFYRLNLVRAVKGRPIKNAKTEVRGVLQEISEATRADNVGMAVRWLADEYRDRCYSDDVVLVPVPSSKNCLASRPADAPLRLAVMLSEELIPSPLIEPVLCWKVPMPSAHNEGGSRNPAVLLPFLTHVGTLRPGTRCVLVDDMTTSGARMVACAAKLRQMRANVLFGLAVGRTVQAPVVEPFMPVEQDVPDLP